MYKDTCTCTLKHVKGNKYRYMDNKICLVIFSQF